MPKRIKSAYRKDSFVDILERQKYFILNMGVVLIILLYVSSYFNNLQRLEASANGIKTVTTDDGVVIREIPGQKTDPNKNPPARLGDRGWGVTLPKDVDAATQKKVDDGWKTFVFNKYISDLISVDRTLIDWRDPWCKEPGRFRTDLPDTSVIICFYNEDWTVLIRTIHSVIDKSPDHLLKEIILIDDKSDYKHLKKKLDNYIKRFNKVRLIRLKERSGLVRARLVGIGAAKGKVLTFLDSHIECSPGWLEPLLDRIAEDPKNVPWPVIDVISDIDFGYQWNTEMRVGGFSWDLVYSWHSLPKREMFRRKHAAEPIRTPTMAGGLFSIDKDFFMSLGTYDPGFKIWGHENLELSFKIWMCGGQLEMLPCSHVGHVFRTKSPYFQEILDTTVGNAARVAEVWLDEYKELFYDYHDRRVVEASLKEGNIEARKEFRKRLNCKSFKWYLDNVYQEQSIPDTRQALGDLRSQCMNATYAAINKSCKKKHCRKRDEHRPLDRCFEI